MIHRTMLALVVLIAVPSMAAAPAPLTGRWKTDDGKGIVVMAPCGAKMCGRIEKLLIKQPAGGQLDERNPDKAKRGRKVTGVTAIQRSPTKERAVRTVLACASRFSTREALSNACTCGFIE